jgi:hypothetical protein
MSVIHTDGKGRSFSNMIGGKIEISEWLHDVLEMKISTVQ